MSKSVLQKLVVDMFSVGSEYGTSADQAAQDGERGFENWQAERNYGNSDGNNGGSFLCSFESERAEQEPDEQAA